MASTVGSVFSSCPHLDVEHCNTHVPDDSEAYYNTCPVIAIKVVRVDKIIERSNWCGGCYNVTINSAVSRKHGRTPKC